MSGRVPQRKCVGCNVSMNKDTLLRIARVNDKEYRINAGADVLGRSAYICHNSQCLVKAIKCKGLDRSFRAKVPATVIEALEKELTIGHN